MQKILKFLRKADEDYKLIEANDKVIVGVSGGKDSMLLLKALAQYRLFEGAQFELIAVHLKMGFSNMDSTPIRSFCKELKISFIEVDAPIYQILQNYKKADGSLDCSRCSKLKRGAIVNAAIELQANKIAFAHHRDDAVETLFLNAIYGGKLTTFQPKIEYEDNHITFIRPFVYVAETNIISTVNKEQIPVVTSTCPKDHNSKREDIKQTLASIYSSFPEAKENFVKMLQDEKVKLWKHEGEN